MKPVRFFVTGTDTGVGKTLVTAALLQNARAFGRQAVGLKPVSAGCSLVDGRWANADALLLQEHSSVRLDYAQVNPVALEPAMAPHIAARRAGTDLHAAPLVEAVRRVAEQNHDALLVEGAGGWLVPLNDTETMADVAAGLG
ncbi:MAG: dethiobiotin synthase, partial [Gammaproteobacteria bacterium]|nr:dethiobiotin synthase [Gammaproteobacteria bacterium]